MREKFIAVSIKGQEFTFDKRRMIAVPTSSAKKIADVLTEMKYKLKNDNEVWYVHDNDFYYNDYIDSEIKRYSKRMPVYRYHG